MRPWIELSVRQEQQILKTDTGSSNGLQLFFFFLFNCLPISRKNTFVFRRLFFPVSIITLVDLDSDIKYIIRKKKLKLFWLVWGNRIRKKCHRRLSCFFKTDNHQYVFSSRYINTLTRFYHLVSWKSSLSWVHNLWLNNHLFRIPKLILNKILKFPLSQVISHFLTNQQQQEQKNDA